MSDAPLTPAGRHIPFKRGGWGTALFICLLAVLCAAFATYVHTRTFREPTDVRMRAAGDPVTHQ